MRYDDRLATVLRLNVSSPVVARIQFRQLIDLLGTCPPDARCELLDQAYVRLAELSARIGADERAAALAEPGLRLRAPRLVAALAGAEPEVALAAIRAAALREEEWLDLIPALPVRARGCLRARDDFAEPVRALMGRLGIAGPALPGAAVPEPEGDDVLDLVPELAVDPVNVVPLPARPAEPIGGIGAIVERIEAFRRAREAGGPGGVAESPQLPLGDSRTAPTSRLESVDFATDPAGRVCWCDSAAAPMLTGRGLAGFPALRPAMRQRLPVRAARIVLAGAPAITGEWQVDAMPQFEGGGRFTGYLGRLRRPSGEPMVAASAAVREAERLRQVLHELRTPVNAIQGFAEIVQQQLFGPTPHQYRALSAVIVADAARMLAGFEELERLARLGSGTMSLGEGECDLAEIARNAIARLAPPAAAQGFSLTLSGGETAMPIGLAPVEAERLCWRLLATLAAAAAPGEALSCHLATSGEHFVLEMALPARLAMRDDAALFSGDSAVEETASGLGSGLFGSGFALRLARMEAQAAGGTLSRDKEKLNLSLPRLTPVATAHSNGAPRGRDRKGPPAA